MIEIILIIIFASIFLIDKLRIIQTVVFMNAVLVYLFKDLGVVSERNTIVYYILLIFMTSFVIIGNIYMNKNRWREL